MSFSAPANTQTNGVIGYWQDEWKTIPWEGTYDANGSFVTTVELPAGLGEARVQKYYAAIWNNDKQAMEDVAVELKNIRLIYNTGSDTTTTTTTEPVVNTAVAEFTDSIANVTLGDTSTITFAQNGTYTFSGTDYYGGDDSKNLSFYETGDTLSIKFTYNSNTNAIIHIEYLELTQNVRTVKGDINGDNQFGVSDVVLLQKWLLNVPDASLANWKAGDLYEDGKINAFDLCMMKRMLINS